MNLAHPPADTLRLDPAVSDADRELVYRLRYRAYRAADGIAPRASEQVRDDMDDHPFARSYLLRDGDRVVGTIRSNVYRHGQPGHRLFLADNWPIETMPWLAEADAVVESSRFAVDPDLPEHQMPYLLRLFSVHNANAAAHGARYVISAVQRRHIPFYRLRLKFEVVSVPLQVAGLNIEPCSVVRLDCPRHRPALEARFPDTVVPIADAERLAIPAPPSRSPASRSSRPARRSVA